MCGVENLSFRNVDYSLKISFLPNLTFMSTCTSLEETGFTFYTITHVKVISIGTTMCTVSRVYMA